MLVMPSGSSRTASLIGIDPGTTTLGVGVLFIDIPTWTIVASEAATLHGDRLAKKDTWTEDTQGNRYNRIAALQATLLSIFRYYHPLVIASEAPFINRRMPTAGLALTEAVAAIRAAVMEYDVWKTLHMVDPPTVKNAVGVSGKKGGPAGKDLMHEAVVALAPSWGFRGPVPVYLLDEHSIDALAVAYCRFLSLKEELCL